MIESKQSDFWWLTAEESVKYKYVYLCFQPPYSDEPNIKQNLLFSPRYFSVDKNGQLSEEIEYYLLEFISHWRKKNNNINIFRSLSLFSDKHNGGEIRGPFLIDIDRQDKTDKGYIQNLSKALEDIRRLATEYLCEFNEDDFRVFFSGHKGFNIEVLPSALGINQVNNQRQQFDEKREEINAKFGSKFLDNNHDEIRLHNSINSWIANDGKTMDNMRFELSLDEIWDYSVEEICKQSEKLALEYLSRI